MWVCECVSVRVWECDVWVCESVSVCACACVCVKKQWEWQRTSSYTWQHQLLVVWKGCDSGILLVLSSGTNEPTGPKSDLESSEHKQRYRHWLQMPLVVVVVVVVGVVLVVVVVVVVVVAVSIWTLLRILFLFRFAYMLYEVLSEGLLVRPLLGLLFTFFEPRKLSINRI